MTYLARSRLPGCVSWLCPCPAGVRQDHLGGIQGEEAEPLSVLEGNLAGCWIGLGGASHLQGVGSPTLKRSSNRMQGSSMESSGKHGFQHRICQVSALVCPRKAEAGARVSCASICVENRRLLPSSD